MRNQTRSMFLSDIRGSVALTFSICALILLGMISLAVDYGMRLRYQTLLDHAIDAAALAGVEQIRTDIQAGKTSSASITDATAVAQQVYSANLGLAQSTLGATASFSFSNVGSTWTTTASYSAGSPTTVAKIFGYSSFGIQRTVSTTITLGSYLSFYLLVDVSGSMGLPSTNSGQTKLASVNPDDRSQYPNGCTFACHFPGYSGYPLSRNGGNGSNPSVTYCPQPDTSACIQLRVDAVAYAVQQLISTAQSTATLPNQFSIGLYPFIVHMNAYVPVTTNLATVSTNAGNLTSLLDTGSGVLGSGGTHFENALPEMGSAILNVGDGSSSASPRPFVFFVTDGAQDNQQQSGGSWWGSNQATTLDESACTQLKNRGITVSVLYIPYTPIQNPTNFAGGEDFAANSNIANIPGHLQACASPGFYFAANTPSDITSAMQAMFQQSLQSARITK